jgi:hypothetical protein
MKRLWPTILLVAICVAGFWYASSKDFFKEKKDEAQQVFNVKKEDVVSFSIQNGDNVIELQKKDTGWIMTKPSSIPVESFSIDGWIDSFNLTTKDKIVEEHAADLAKYGLDKPKQKFTVNLQDGSVKILNIGDKLPFPGYSYAAADGSDEVFRIGDQQLTWLNKQQIDFMEKSPVKANLDKVSFVAVDWKGGKWTLTKSEPDKNADQASWKLGDKETKGADAAPIIDKILYMSTDQLVKPLSGVSMDSPELRIEIKETDAGKETATVYTGKLNGDHVWIAKQGGEWAYAIPADTVQAMFDSGKQTTDASK